jgi:hypothetical protein
MARNVFILGAGASREGGAPLMFDFLDTARDLLRSDLVDDSRESFERVFRSISALQRVHSKSQLDMNNIEAVFSAFEMAQIIGSLPGHSPRDIEALVPSMRVVIARTIEEKLRFQRSLDHRDPPQPYWHFAELLSFLKDQAIPKEDSCVITFNYDLATDFALLRRGIAITYALDESSPANYPVLKLHGSLNWFLCRTCDKIVPWDLTPFTMNLTPLEMASKNYIPLRLSTLLHQWEHIQQQVVHDVVQQPVLVPPTWNKAEYQKLLASVWRRAATELQTAENIFAIGFSLPPTDEFFRHLYSLGTVGDNILRHFWVIDPDPTGVVEERFRRLLGPGAEQRFSFFRETFGAAIKRIHSLYKAL